MNRLLARLPLLLTLIICAGLLWHGPIAQLAHYHDFADKRMVLGLYNAADVLSNLGFLIAGLYGLLVLYPQRHHSALAKGWTGYLVFLLALILTAAGSGFYHVAPDNARLVFDRLPIALACAGLLSAVRAETRADGDGKLALLVLAALASVMWWYVTDRYGHGDLRPYLLIQGLPLLLIPLWHAIASTPRADRLAFGFAIGLYVAAKIAELHDHELLAISGWISGHTLKHLLAATAAMALIGRLVHRVRTA